MKRKSDLQLSGSSGDSYSTWSMRGELDFISLKKSEGERDSKFEAGESGFDVVLDVESVSNDAYFSSDFCDSEAASSSLYGISEEGILLQEMDKEVFVGKGMKTVEFPSFEDKGKPDLAQIVERLRAKVEKDDSKKYEDLFKRLEELVRQAREELRTDIEEGYGNIDLFLGQILVAKGEDIDLKELEEIIKAHDEQD
ncbi:hypothetical protein [Candidatus Mycoplasma haematohominis]|uniref:hypothetical protein n=1 Tax=Candidatus Mycoplasma haematohominis TaxID=1494318 RepID=UPI001C0A6C36|nr:hypothetical protein [Candidatus Mycoplasma haemohominis]